MTIGRRQLERIGESLTDRDAEVLGSLMGNRYLSTVQIRRLHFTGHASDLACARAANRELDKLRSAGLITSLERRIGGVRAGSASFVWTLTDAGARMLRMLDPDAYPADRRRVAEPSNILLAHTLMVGEICLAFAEAAREGIVSIMDIEHEPKCWREFISGDGAKTMLKPDLAIGTADCEFEDRWFLEADLDTEPLSRIGRTCKRYQDYCDTGVEQKASGVFPAVVWVVPGRIRKEAIEGRIRAEKGLRAQIFRVVALPDLRNLIIKGAGI